MPTPVIFAHVAKRSTDTALRRDGVAASREYLGDTRRGQTLLNEAECRSETGAAGADDDYIVAMVDKLLLRTHPVAPNATLRTAKTPATTTPMCTNVETISADIFKPVA